MEDYKLKTALAENEAVTVEHITNTEARIMGLESYTPYTWGLKTWLTPTRKLQLERGQISLEQAKGLAIKRMAEEKNKVKVAYDTALRLMFSEDYTKPLTTLEITLDWYKVAGETRVRGIIHVSNGVISNSHNIKITGSGFCKETQAVERLLDFCPLITSLVLRHQSRFKEGEAPFKVGTIEPVWYMGSVRRTLDGLKTLTGADYHTHGGDNTTIYYFNFNQTKA